MRFHYAQVLGCVLFALLILIGPLHSVLLLFPVFLFLFYLRTNQLSDQSIIHVEAVFQAGNSMKVKSIKVWKDMRVD